MSIESIIKQHNSFFKGRKTFDINYRLKALNRLEEAIHYYEAEINWALYKDLGKSRTESYMCEVGLTLKELSYIKKHLKSWTRKKRVHTSIANFPAKSYLIQEPFGTVLIMSPWNYPFLLCIEPLIGAIAAGNCVVLKPSEYSPAVSIVITKIVARAFGPAHVSVVTGGRSENAALLEQRFDYIFFTGSIGVGRLVMEKAAQYLTPVSLELGGKSPCIIEKSANLKLAAKRLVFGKYLNCGQTCVAPDYVYVDEAVKNTFVKYVKGYITQMFGQNPISNSSYGKIINEKHFDRLCKLMDTGKIIHGGKSSRELLKIEPTVVDHVTPTDPLMQEEIFGPILPILTYHDIAEAEAYITKNPKPLAFYLFTESKEIKHRFLTYTSFGGGCINDTIMHLVSTNMGFGGVGDSGMGSYHGKRSFSTFSHEKGILIKSSLIDIPIRYQPYKSMSYKLIKKLL